MNQYSNTLRKLYSINVRKGIKLGLENVFRLHEALGSPCNRFSTVHVAGTNGKGSVCAKIAKGLESKYSNVGRYCSPHISTYRERITINQKIISEEDVQENLSQIWAIAERENIPATFFELTTLLAFKYFAENNVEIAVIETGLGGRLDATNIITPVLSIITSIAYDHMEFLGYTLEDIAKEKGGIVKTGIPVILGPNATLVPVKEGCRSILIKGKFNDVESENRAIASAALEFLKIPAKAIGKAITTRLPCRRESVPFQDRNVILDVSHNPQGLVALFHDLKIPKQKLRVVCALSKGKDLENCLRAISRGAEHIHLVEPQGGRCASPLMLREILTKVGIPKTRSTIHAGVADGMNSALSQSKPLNQEVIVCGTFYMMREARQFLGIEEPQDLIDINEK